MHLTWLVWYAKTKKQSKAYGSHVKHSYCCPVNKHWDACASLRNSSLVQANPSGAGLVTHRRTVQVSQIEVAEPKVPQWPHTARTVGHLLPQFTRGTHWWVGCFPSYTRSPFIQLGRLEQCEWSFLVKETTTTPKWPHRESNPQPTWLCCLSIICTFNMH